MPPFCSSMLVGHVPCCTLVYLVDVVRTMDKSEGKIGEDRSSTKPKQNCFLLLSYILLLASSSILSYWFVSVNSPTCFSRTCSRKTIDVADPLKKKSYWSLVQRSLKRNEILLVVGSKQDRWSFTSGRKKNAGVVTGR